MLSTNPTHETQDELMTPGEVAALFGVDPKTVTRWASAGKLHPLRTLGGHRRYRSTEVYGLLERSGSGQAGHTTRRGFER